MGQEAQVTSVQESKRIPNNYDDLVLLESGVGFLDENSFFP